MMKILIAEDTEDSRILLEKLLRSQGYDVQSATNGSEALAFAHKEPPDLVISDILMPEMDGFDLCRQFKTETKLKKTPFIFYSATYTDAQDVELAMSLGAARFVNKPVAPEKMIQIVDEVIMEREIKSTPIIEDLAGLDIIHKNIVSKKLDKKISELGIEREKLKESEKKYRRLVESLRDKYFFYSRGADGTFTYLSRSIVTVLGYTQEELLSQCTEYLTNNPINKEVKSSARLSLQGEKQPCYELEVLHKNGSLRRLEVTEEPIFDHSGQVIAVEGIAHDITERYETGKNLAEARDEWERTFQAINDPVLILDPQMRIVRTNQAVGELLGKDSDQLKNQFCYQLFHDSSQPCAGCPVVLTLEDSQPHFNEIEHKHLNKTFLVSSSPKFDQQEKLSGIVYSAKDITEKKQLETQLQQMQKMEALGTLAGGIAHDFNNILTSIIGYSQILALELAPESKEQTYLEHILIAGNRAKELVSQILTFSRERQEEKKPVQIQLILKEALKLLRPSIPTNIEFKQHIDPNCGMILADPSQTHQLIMNLCTNGYHAMRETGGTLGVSLNQVHIDSTDFIMNLDLQPGEYLKLEVSDTGCGMEKFIQDKIFDPYFTTKKKGEGTGLGLSVVLGIIKNFNGHITVYSELNKGTTFHVYLPIIDASPLPPGILIDEPLVGGNERIIVVDDEEHISKLEHELLTRIGYHVTAMTSTVDVIDLFRKHPNDFDLIITDMSMPIMTGVELASKLLAIRKDIPIILYSGFSEIINDQQAQALGIRRYIMKPSLGSEFAKAVRAVLDDKDFK